MLLRELDDLCIEYLFGKSRSLSVTTLADDCAYRVSFDVSEPPPVISAVFGDVLNNLRAVLDYTARGLVLKAGRVPVDGGRGSTMFPIAQSARKKDLVDIAPGLPPDVREVLDQLQPYRATAPATHPLSLLAKLNNNDKHRLLNVVSLREAGNVVFAPASVPDLTISSEMRTYRLPVRREEQIVSVHPDDLHPQAQARGQWTGTVILADSEVAGAGQQVSAICRRIALHITDVVLPALRDFMPSTSPPV